MKLLLLFVLKLTFFGLASAKSIKTNAAPIIVTKYGSIRGFSEFDSFLYLGIPYAQPPINELRWQYPQDPSPWSPNVLNATAFQSACPQIHTCDPQIICPPTVG